MRLPAHPRLLEGDLRGWAGEPVAAGGRKDALLGRVETLRLALDGASIEARVRGNRPVAYHVRAWVDGEQLACRCTCAPQHASPCRHAVAAIEALRFPRPELTRDPAGRALRRRGRLRSGRGRVIQHAQGAPGFVLLGGPERLLTRDERLKLAREEEVAARRQRARREQARVEALALGGAPRYDVADSHGEPQRVTLRGASAELAHCTCADFADNELGTCKHVERALSWRARQRKAQRAAPSAGALSLWCRARSWVEERSEPLYEIRIDHGAALPPGALGRHFDEAGWLRPADPEIQPAIWARRAVAAVRRAARRYGLAFDVDPAVASRIRAAAAEDALRSRRESFEIDGAAWQEIRSSLGLCLHGYQEQGAQLLARCGRAFLADDMGLGKTVQAIAAALLLRRTAGARRALVVCPASLKHQWSREIEKVCGERAVVLEGLRPERLAAYRRWRRGFLILNYELVLRDIEALREASPDLVILDEAQRIKNWGTKTARAVKRLSSPHAFILTGTPLENRLIELHSLVEFLHPRGLGPRWRLLPSHAVTDSRGRVIAYEGLDALRRRLGGFFLRRERRAVLDELPERTDNTFWTELSAAQRRPYRRHVATLAALVKRQRPLGPGEVAALLRALTSMRILCNAHAQYAWDRHSARLLGEEPPSRGELRALGSPKIEEFVRVLDDLLDESPEKIVVFSQWERMLRLAHFAAREALVRRDLRAEVFHGGLNGRARERMLDAFHRDPDFRILFSTDAGGLGLNLQEAASVVVNLEVPWNPAVLEQRVGRVHRLGQRKSVQVLHFVTRGAIEERVRQMVEAKRALFDGLFVEQVERVEFDEGTRASLVERVRSLVDESPA